MTTEERSRRNKARNPLVFVGLFWVVILVAGMALFMRYENRAGIEAEPPGEWPVASRIQKTNDRSTLLVLAHPHCPCTRATINELARLVARVGDRLAVYVIFTKPAGVEQGWEQSDTWTSAAEIPGVKVVSDREGRESQLFGASTSGQSLLYDKNGKLLFSGGITIGRGAQGDSVGAASIVSLVNEETEAVRVTSVFGCPLFSEAYCHLKKEALDANTAP